MRHRVHRLAQERRPRAHCDRRARRPRPIPQLRQRHPQGTPGRGRGCSTRSTSSSSPPPSSTRPIAVSSRTPAGDADSRTTRSTRTEERPALPDPPHPDDRPRPPRQRTEGPPRQNPHAGNLNGELHISSQLHKQTPRDPTPQAGRRLAVLHIQALHTCPIPEIARTRPDPTSVARADPGLLATSDANNGQTETINGRIEKTRRLAHDFHNAHLPSPPHLPRSRRNPPLPTSHQPRLIPKSRRWSEVSAERPPSDRQAADPARGNCSARATPDAHVVSVSAGSRPRSSVRRAAPRRGRRAVPGRAGPRRDPRPTSRPDRWKRLPGCRR